MGFVVAGCTFLGACSAIYDESDCVDSAAVFTFTADMNLHYADAFLNSVKKVHVLMFDLSGTLQYQWDVPQKDLIDGNKLNVNVRPGIYDVITWGGNYHQSASVARGIPGVSRIEDFHCRVNRDADNQISDDIECFFHCIKRVELPYSAQSKPHRVFFNLTKDTNTVKIILQQLSGDPVDMSELNVSITDNNGWLNHDNSLRSDAMLTYRPWHVNSGTVASLGAMTTQFTVSRLFQYSNPTVTVTRADGSAVLSIPLIDYALLVKSKYNEDMPDQEYLDRQDEYNMTFFLDSQLKWVDTRIIINDWVIVNNNVDMHPEESYPK